MHTRFVNLSLGLGLAALVCAPGCAGPSGTPALDAGPGEAADAGPSGPRPISPELQQRIVALVAPSVDPSGAQWKAVGLAVGVLSPNVRGVLGFGTTRIGQQAPPTGDTIFEIGSVSKVFTGFLLARSIEQGQHQLAEPIDAWFPRGAPKYQGQSITMLDLATHTSGLPDMPTNLHARPPNAAAGYSADDLAAFLSTYALTAAPGQSYVYSNVGSGALGYLLGLASPTGQSDYAGVLRHEVTEPLGLLDTTLSLSAAQEPRRAQGYASGQPAPINDIGPALVGGGAIRSTAEDMLRFLGPALGAGAPQAVATWKTVLEARRPMPAGHIGLFVTRDETVTPVVFTKSGLTAGFTSMVVFTTSPPAAVVVLANSAQTVGLYELAKAILGEVQAVK